MSPDPRRGVHRTGLIGTRARPRPLRDGPYRNPRPPPPPQRRRDDAYLSKGGQPEELIGRRCLCVGLVAAAGLGAPGEPAILTAGDALRHVATMLRPGESTYSARDVIQRIVGDTAAMDVINAFIGGR